VKHTIELDPTMHFNPNGMGGCVFFGDSDDGFEFNMTWDELIDNEFEMQTIPKVLGYNDSAQKGEVLSYHDGDWNAAQDLYDIIVGLENAAKKMRERLENTLVLDRKEWLKANNGEFNQENQAEFLKYFSYDMVESDLLSEQKENEVEPYEIVYSGLRTPDGTLLESRHVHDYVSHIDETNGKEYMLDGGLDYVRCSVNGDEELITLTMDDDHEEIRQHFSWGTYGIDADMPLTFIRLNEMRTDHIEACLDTIKSLSPKIKKVFENELDYRKKSV